MRQRRVLVFYQRVKLTCRLCGNRYDAAKFPTDRRRNVGRSSVCRYCRRRIPVQRLDRQPIMEARP